MNKTQIAGICLIILGLVGLVTMPAEYQANLVQFVITSPLSALFWIWVVWVSFDVLTRTSTQAARDQWARIWRVGRTRPAVRQVSQERASQDESYQPNPMTTYEDMIGLAGPNADAGFIRWWYDNLVDKPSRRRVR